MGTGYILNGGGATGLVPKGEVLEVELLEPISSGAWLSLNNDKTKATQYTGVNPAIALRKGLEGETIKVAYNGENSKPLMVDNNITSITDATTYLNVITSGTDYVKINMPTSDITDSASLFKLLRVMNLDLSSLDMTNFTNLNQTFSSGYFKTIIFGKNAPKNVTNFTYVFNNASNLLELDLSDFVLNVNSFQFAFGSCQRITKIIMPKVNNGIIVDFTFAFTHCKLLSEIDLSMYEFAADANVAYAFDGATSLQKVYVKDEVTKAYMEANANPRPASVQFIVKV